MAKTILDQILMLVKEYCYLIFDRQICSHLFMNPLSIYFLFFYFYFLIIFLTSLLEYNCFTMLGQFLLYNKVNQLYIYIYPHISSLLHLPPTLPFPPLQVVTKHQADLPVLCGCFPLSILHLVVYICPCHSLTSSQLTLPTPRVLKYILYVCVSTPVLPLGSSGPFFFQIPYICVSIRYLFFSF